MAIYNSRQGSAQSITVTPSALTEMSYAALCGANYLRTSTSSATIQAQLGHIGVGNIAKVFGVSTLSTFDKRQADVYSGSTSLMRNPVADKTQLGSKDLSDIANSAINRGAGLVTISIVYTEVYNANSGATYLTYPAAASVTKYHT